jgi:hypothetical protein
MGDVQGRTHDPHPGAPVRRAVACCEPLREHHRRDRLVPVEQTAGETRHDPGALPISRRVRAVPRGHDHAPDLGPGPRAWVPSGGGPFGPVPGAEWP